MKAKNHSTRYALIMTSVEQYLNYQDVHKTSIVVLEEQAYKKREKTRDTRKVDKGLNNDNNSIYNYSSAAKERRPFKLNFSPTQKCCKFQLFAPQQAHTHTQNSYYILKSGQLSTLEYLNPTQCKTASSSRLFAMQNTAKRCSHEEPLLRSTSRQKWQLYCSARFEECICVSQYKKFRHLGHRRKRSIAIFCWGRWKSNLKAWQREGTRLCKRWQQK